jgi:hypothetical protein
MKNLHRLCIAAAAASLSLASIAAAGPASAAGVKVGVLNCDVAGGWGFVLGSSKDLQCTFSPVNGVVEHYTGAVSKFGVDLGYTRGGVIVWEVVAPHAGSNRGALEGGYAGLTGSASIGVGAGAHVLVGGLHRSITLQPISITGERGLNVAAGIGAISLTFVR